MDGILGQQRVVDLLQGQLRADRPHHAYVFHGPTGVGKFTTAMAMSRILLCHDRDFLSSGSAAACGCCVSCKQFGAGKVQSEPNNDEASDEVSWASPHPDLHMVTKELARYSTSVQIRQRKLTQIPLQVLRTALIEPLSRAPSLGHGKIFIVDEAELLNAPGQNLLLKVLEEPPPQTTIILVTSKEERLLATIRSRCQCIAFAPLPNSVVTAWLDRHAKRLDSDQCRGLVEFADGSLGQVYLALTYGLMEWSQSILPMVESLVLGRGSGELGREMADRINNAAECWVKAHAGASKEAASRRAASWMWSMIGSRVRQQISQISQRCEPSVPEASNQLMSPWLGVLDAIGESERLLEANVNLSIVCDHLAMAMNRSLAPVAT